jgi:hypothetical protein
MNRTLYLRLTFSKVEEARALLHFCEQLTPTDVRRVSVDIEEAETMTIAAQLVAGALRQTVRSQKLSVLLSGREGRALSRLMLYSAGISHSGSPDDVDKLEAASSSVFSALLDKNVSMHS